MIYCSFQDENGLYYCSTPWKKGETFIIQQLGASLIALTVARCLARHGMQVTLITDRDGPPVASSVSVKDKLLLPSLLDDPHGYINYLEENLVTGDYDVLFPVGTDDTLLISKHLDRLSRYCYIPFLSYDRIYEVHNKKSLVEVCEKIGLKVPRTVVPETVEEVKKNAENISCPVVIKLQDSTGSRGLAFAKTVHELITCYLSTIKEFSLSEDDLPLIQECIPGTGYGVSCLYNNGQLRAFFTHKRIREISPFGGASTCRESVRYPLMEEMAFALLDHLQWHGVAMVEFKLDDRTGEPVILEVNPRFWGSLDMAITAGVDFPWLLYQMAVNGDVLPITKYRVGLRSRCLLTDAVSFIKHVKEGMISSSYLKDFIGLHRKKTHLEVFSWKDPKPFFSFIVDQIVRGNHFTR